MIQFDKILKDFTTDKLKVWQINYFMMCMNAGEKQIRGIKYFCFDLLTLQQQTLKITNRFMVSFFLNSELKCVWLNN